MKFYLRLILKKFKFPSFKNLIIKNKPKQLNNIKRSIMSMPKLKREWGEESTVE